MDNIQFDKNYKLKTIYTDNPGNYKKQKFIENIQIQKQKGNGLRPQNINYYERIMYENIHKEDEIIIGYYCNMIPQEIIYAMDAKPVRLDCGNNAAAVIGEELFSGEICPVAKASFGRILSKDSLDNKSKILIIPTSCDAKRKMGEIINDYVSTFMLNLPPEKNHSLYAKTSYKEILRLIKFLEKKLKTNLSRKKLLSQIDKINKRTLLIRELQNERIKNPQALSILDLYLIIQSSIFRIVDLDEWNNETEKLLNQIKKYKSERKNLKPRMILTGAPIIWPNFKVLNILEECGVEIIADTICTGAQSCYDPVIIDEKNTGALLRSLVNKYIYGSICPCFISQGTRLNRIIDLINETKADGVINYSLRLCQVFDIENYKINKILKNNKISFLNIRTDYSLEDTEQLRVRIEAFLENL